MGGRSATRTKVGCQDGIVLTTTDRKTKMRGYSQISSRNRGKGDHPLGNQEKGFFRGSNQDKIKEKVGD